MHREKMDGVNLREGIMEVAFEQWTERTCGRQQSINPLNANTGAADADSTSRLQRFPTLQGSGIG